MLRGIALNQASPSQIVWVQTQNGVIRAIAAGEIIGGEVFVSNGLAWATTGRNAIATSTVEIYRSREAEEEIVEPVILPFQVLFVEPLQLGGDRAQLTLGDAAAVGGVNNLGANEYDAVWAFETGIVRDRNGELNFYAYPYEVSAADYVWLGNGLIASDRILKELPDVEPTVEETGLALSNLLKIPTYQTIVGLPLGTRQGSNTETKQAQSVESSLSYEKATQWLHSTFKNGDTPTPNAASVPISCNFFTSGTTYTYNYSQQARFDYSIVTNSRKVVKIDKYLNNQRFGTERIENYTLNYSITQPTSTFQTTTNFDCTGSGGTFGVYFWSPQAATFYQWTGEEHTITSNSSQTIIEEFDHPIDDIITLPYADNTTINIAETTTANFASQNGSVGVGSTSQFPVDGVETKTSTKSEVKNQKLPKTLLLSQSGTIYSNEEFSLNKNIQSQTSSLLRKYLRDFSHDFPTVESSTVVTIVDKQTERSLFVRVLADRESILINTDTSFLIKASGTVDNLTEIDKSEIALFYTHYKKTEDKITNQITYSESTTRSVPVWDNLNSRAVYILSNNVRYLGTITSFTTTDEPIIDTPEVIRSIDSLTIAIVQTEDYPATWMESGKFLIYPQDNCSVLVRDFLLNDENRRYCNLVDRTIYFAKSVIDRLDETTQAAQTYQIISDRIIQSDFIEGEFIPVAQASNVLGVSFHPNATL